MNKFYLIIVLAIFSFALNAQEYKHTLGFRSGVSLGFSYQYQHKQNKVLEAIVTSRLDGLQLTALVETKHPLEFGKYDNFYAITGMGFHAGYYNKTRRKYWKDPYYSYSRYDLHFTPIIGMDAILGLGYKFHTVPISMNIDAKPYFDLLGRPFFDLFLWDFGFTVRYHFN